MARRRARGLHRNVAVAAVAGTIFGNVAAGGFLALGVTAKEALGATPLIFIVAGIALMLMLLTFIEGIAMLPQTAGSSGFARVAFNDIISFIAGWALALDYLIIVAASAFFASHYLASIPGLGVLASSPWDVVCSVVLVLGVGLINVRRIQIGARIAVVIALVALVFELLLILVGLVLLFEAGSITDNFHLGMSPTWGQLAFALPVAMIGFTGLDIVANLSGELREPGSQLPRPMMMAALVAVVMFVALGVLGLSALPVTMAGGVHVTELGTTWIDRPIVGIIEAMPVGESVHLALRTLLGIIAAMVLFLTANTGIAGVSRLAYAMSRNRQIPTALARVDRDAGVPVTAVILFSIVTAGLLVLTATLRSSALVLAQLYAFGSMLSLTIACASLVRLRFTRPDLERPYRTPLNVSIRGVDVSLIAVAATVSAAGMWVLVLATHDAARALGIIWMVVGSVGYAGYRMTRGLEVARVAEVQAEPEVQIVARSYRRVLLAIRPERGRLWGAGDAELAALANKLLDDGGEIAVMLVHEIPLVKPLNAPLGAVEEETTERLTLLRKVTQKLNLPLSSTVARARAAGRAICQEAERRETDALVMAMRCKVRGGDAVFGKTVSYVLRHAPCDVIVMSFPLASIPPRPQSESASGVAEPSSHGRETSS